MSEYTPEELARFREIVAQLDDPLDTETSRKLPTPVFQYERRTQDRRPVPPTLVESKTLLDSDYERVLRAGKGTEKLSAHYLSCMSHFNVALDVWNEFESDPSPAARLMVEEYIGSKFCAYYEVANKTDAKKGGKAQPSPVVDKCVQEMRSEKNKTRLARYIKGKYSVKRMAELHGVSWDTAKKALAIVAPKPR